LNIAILVQETALQNPFEQFYSEKSYNFSGIENHNSIPKALGVIALIDITVFIFPQFSLSTLNAIFFNNHPGKNLNIHILIYIFHYPEA
jgi:hypothetical protein